MTKVTKASTGWLIENKTLEVEMFVATYEKAMTLKAELDMREHSYLYA